MTNGQREPQKTDHNNNLVSLREYLEAKINSVEKAIDLAREAMEKRLEGMNEFRAQLKDQASVLITRNEVDVQITRINTDIKLLNESKAKLEGKASQSAMNATIALSVAGLILSIATIVVMVLLRN